MKLRSVLLAGALCLASVALVSAKTYDIDLAKASTAGQVQLPAGTYHLKVDDGQATFTNVDENKTYTTPAKLETGAQKYDTTAVLTTKEGAKDLIESIELGGSKTKLDFK